MQLLVLNHVYFINLYILALYLSVIRQGQNTLANIPTHNCISNSKMIVTKYYYMFSKGINIPHQKCCCINLI